MTDLLLAMLRLYGLTEIVGPVHNKIIVNMFQELGYTWIKDDETAWCSAILNYVCMKLGYERSHSLAARSWANIGTKVEKPYLGVVAVFYRISLGSGLGHVGLYINENENGIYTLGGNQNNQMNIAPQNPDHLIGYFELKKLSGKSLSDLNFTLNFVTLYQLIKLYIHKIRHRYV